MAVRTKSLYRGGLAADALKYAVPAGRRTIVKELQAYQIAAGGPFLVQVIVYFASGGNSPLLRWLGAGQYDSIRLERWTVLEAGDQVWGQAAGGATCSLIMSGTELVL